MTSFSKSVTWLLLVAMTLPQLALASPKDYEEPLLNSGIKENVRRIFLYERKAYPRTEETAKQLREGKIESIELRYHGESAVSNTTSLYFEAVHHYPGKPSKALGGHEFELTTQSGEKVTRRGMTYDDYVTTNTALSIDVDQMWEFYLFGRKNMWSSSNIPGGLWFREIAAFAGTALSIYAVYAIFNQGSQSTRQFGKVKNPATGEYETMKFRGKGIWKRPVNDFLAIWAAFARSIVDIHKGKSSGGGGFAKAMFLVTDVGMILAWNRVLNHVLDKAVFGKKAAQLDFLGNTITESYELATDNDPFDQAAYDFEGASKDMQSMMMGKAPEEVPVPAEKPNAESNGDRKPEKVAATVADIQPVVPDWDWTIEAFENYFTKYYEPYSINLVK